MESLTSERKLAPFTANVFSGNPARLKAGLALCAVFACDIVGIWTPPRENWVETKLVLA